MSKQHHGCGHSPSTPPLDGGLLDLFSSKGPVPQISGFASIGLPGSGDTSDTNAALAAHVGASEGAGAGVSLLAGANLAGDSGLLSGLDKFDQPCLLDGLFGDCGLI